MRKTSFAIAAGLTLLSGSAFATCDKYGNCYFGSGGYSSGYNSNTGNSWNSRSSGSSTYGTDSRGNSWSYNRDTGNYYNYGTGEMRSHGRRY